MGTPTSASALRPVDLEESKEGPATLRATLTPAAGLEEPRSPVTGVLLKPEDVRIWVVTSTAERAFVETIRQWLAAADDSRLRRIRPEQVEAMPFQSRATEPIAYRYRQATPKPTVVVITYDLDPAAPGGTGVDVAQTIPRESDASSPRPAIILVSPYAVDWDAPQSRAIARVINDRTITTYVRLRKNSRDQDLRQLRRAVTDALTARLAAGLEEPTAAVAQWPSALQAIADQRDVIRAAAQTLGQLGVDIQLSLVTPWIGDDAATEFAPRLKAIEQQATAWLGIPVHLEVSVALASPTGTLRIVKAGAPSTGWTMAVTGLPGDQRLPDSAIAPLIAQALLEPNQSRTIDAAPFLKVGLEEVRRTLDEIFT